MTYEDYRAKVIAAQEQWNQERSGIYLTQHLAQFSSIFNGETQPNQITTPDNFDGMSLAEMQNAVSAMKPSTAHDASEVWDKICQNLSTSLTTFNTAFEATTTAQDGWSGEGASAAVGAVKNYAAQSSTLPAAALAVSLKLAEVRTGLEQTQALMPGITQRPSNTGKALPADGDLKMDDYTTEEAEEESRRILRTVYSQVAVQSDTAVPYMPAAPKIVDGGGDQPVVGGGGPGGSSGGTAGGDNSGQETDSETPGTGTMPGEEPAAAGTQPEEQPSGSDDGSSNDDTSAAATASPTATSPAQTGTPSAATPSTQNPTTNTPLGSTPGMGRGLGSGAGTGGSGGTPTPGRTQPGTPSGDRAATTTTSGRSGAASTGRAGMPGMGAPGAGRGQSGDDEHRDVPDYLINQDNGELLTGIGEIKTVPPVIGGDYDSAEQ
ncbi:MAG: hypothetical protein H5T78_11495 [Nocardia sp.]|nr:hypothetical protein [Nocardia sp.]